MRLTSYSDYSLRVLLYLAGSRGAWVRIREISDACGISENHLSKIVHHLGQSGIVDTRRGRGGGLRLARAPEKIRVGSFLRETEGADQLVECFRGGKCVYAPFCGFQSALHSAQREFFRHLDRFTLADFVESPQFRKGFEKIASHA